MVPRRRVLTALLVSTLASMALATLPSGTVPVAPAQTLPNTITVTANVVNQPAPGAQHVVAVRCLYKNEIPWNTTVSFAGSGTQTVQIPSGYSNCAATGASVPGYTSADVSIDWGGLSGYFYWKKTFPSTTVPRSTVPPVVRPAIEVVGVDFGSQLVGEEAAPRDVLVRNSGGVAWTVGRVDVADPFVVKGGSCLGQLLAPGAECSVSLSVRPANASVVERVVTVDASVVRGQATVRVSGSDVENFSVGGANFGGVSVGSVSAVVSVPVVNVGSLVARLSRVAVSGPFRVQPGGSCDVNVSLAPKQSCSVSVVFVPTAAGDQVGGLEVTAVSPSRDIVARGELRGTGVVVAGRLRVSPPEVDFGSVRVGVVSARQVVTVSNDGTAPLTVSGVGFAVAVPANRKKKTPASTRLVGSSGGFTAVAGASGGCKVGVVLAPGASCAVAVSVKPAKRGSSSIELRVTTREGSSGLSRLGVKGVARSIAAKPSAVVLAPVAVGSLSAPSGPVVVSNTGDEPVTIASVELAGPQKAELSLVSSDCPKAVLVPAASCSLVVQARPGAGAARSGQVVVTTTTKERAVVTLRWSALAGSLVIAPPSLDFGAVAVGSAGPGRSAVVLNTGQVPVVISRFDRSDPSIVVTQACVGSTLAPGGSCPFSVVMTATRPGPFSGAVSVIGAAGEKADQGVTITGRGAATTTTVAATIPVAPSTTAAPVATVAPVLVMRPGVGEIGQPALVVGTNFPANADVALVWEGGVAAGTVRTDANGSFQKSVMALPGLRVGPTSMTGTPTIGGTGATAPYLLIYGTFQPQSSRRNIVTRG